MKTLRSAIFALGLLLVVSGAHAQSIHVSGKVPFDFVVGKKTLPAGEYSVQSLERSPEALNIRNTDEGTSSLTLTRHAEKLNPSKKTVLIFHRVGEQYFLAEIWVAGSSRGTEIPRSQLETQMAKNQTPGNDVIVAANITR
jgi:hypothetical protein